MAGKRAPPTYLSLAVAALVAECEGRYPGIAARARKRLKNEADLSIVVGLHRERESAEERIAHEEAIEWLGRLNSVVTRQNGTVAKGRKRKRA